MGRARSHHTSHWTHGLGQALQALTERLQPSKATPFSAWKVKLGLSSRDDRPALKTRRPLKLRSCQIPAFKDHVKLAGEGRVAQTGDINPEEMRPVLVAAGSLAAGRPLVNGLTFLGFEVQFTLELDEAIEASKRAPDAWSLVAVEIDSFGGICEVVDDLLECRSAVPDVPVILISEAFSRNDFSEDRLPICDASLRKSNARAMLVNAIKAAKSNNFSWRRRLNRLKAARPLGRMARTHAH